jgi:hypothetical protein
MSDCACAWAVMWLSKGSRQNSILTLDLGPTGSLMTVCSMPDFVSRRDGMQISGRNDMQVGAKDPEAPGYHGLDRD